MSVVPHLSRILRYPLKSGAPIPMSEATIGPLGVTGDRRWMLVQPDGLFLTARRLPHLVCLRAEEVPGGLRLTLPDGAARSVPVPPPGGARLQVTVWEDTFSARLVEDAALTAWLSDWLGEPCRLVYQGDEAVRTVDPTFGAPGDVVGFADGFPLLLLSEGSLADLNGRLAQPVSMLHFRPNLVVAGCAPFAEDGWRLLQLGDTVRLEVVKPCSRCVLTTVDPLNGTRSADGEPLRTLARTRRAPPGSGVEGVVFGQNVAVRRGGVVRVGDSVTLLS